MSPVKNSRASRRDPSLSVTVGAGAKSNTAPSQNTMRSGTLSSNRRLRRESRRSRSVIGGRRGGAGGSGKPAPRGNALLRLYRLRARQARQRDQEDQRADNPMVPACRTEPGKGERPGRR